MPGGDRRGPMGEGPQTGRGMGYCTGNTVPGYQTGFGGGFGRGRGRGQGNRFWARRDLAAPLQNDAPEIASQELHGLRSCIQGLQEAVDQLVEKVHALEAKD